MSAFDFIIDCICHIKDVEVSLGNSNPVYTIDEILELIKNIQKRWEEQNHD